MIRRIRAIANSLPGELVGEIFSGLIGPASSPDERLDEPDPSLDLLVQHAMRQDNDVEPDARRIWQQLRKKVRGPFGRLAVEGPAMSTLDTKLLKSGGMVQPAPFAVLDEPGQRQPRHARSKSGAEAIQDRVSPDLLHGCEAQLLLR